MQNKDTLNNKAKYGHGLYDQSIGAFHRRFFSSRTQETCVHMANFPSSREEISKLEIKPPIITFDFRYSSTIMWWFRMILDLLSVDINFQVAVGDYCVIQSICRPPNGSWSQSAKEVGFPVCVAQALRVKGHFTHKTESP